MSTQLPAFREARGPEPGAQAFDRWRALRASIPVPSRGSVAEQKAEAEAVCAEVIVALWDQRTGADRSWLKAWRSRAEALPLHARQHARELVATLKGLSIIEAGFLIGSLYTALLPSEVRSELGAYYTPPVLAERLLNIASAEGIEWSAATALDPACGGGAFLGPLANRILADHKIQSLSSAERLAHLEGVLVGIEIDEFAAWMSQTLLELVVYQEAKAAGRPLGQVVTVANALDFVQSQTRRFDLVIGNPPYGRVPLTSDQRVEFSRSLYGHANIYGVFLDLALRWRTPRGLVVFLTPTSFLGGQYFSRLRELLTREVPPLVIDFVSARQGVFESVQQETCLAVFGHNPSASTVVHLLDLSDRSLSVQRAGAFSLVVQGGDPWLLPRSADQAAVAQRAAQMPTRLDDLGYRASTGPLVWNRHKRQLRTSRASSAYPLIWAEAVRPNDFRFDYRLRSYGFLRLKSGQEHLLLSTPSVLVQRTTAKEQDRRLVACALPSAFLKDAEAVVVENHLNVLKPGEKPRATPAALAAVLNTKAVDQVFRCLSGSVAVSATELDALPLPPPEVFRKVERLIEEQGVREAMPDVEQLVAAAYGVAGTAL